MRRVYASGLVVVAILVASLLSVASASADECRRVVGGEISKYNKKTSKDMCGGKAATSGFVLVEGVGQPVAAGIECYQVVFGEPSGWNNNKCTGTKTNGTSEYVKVAAAKCLESEQEEVEENVLLQQFKRARQVSLVSAFGAEQWPEAL